MLSLIVEQAREGDVAAFQALFERYKDRVYRYVYVRLGSRGEAHDALQDIFLGVWKGLPSFRLEHEGSFPAWLFGIARNVVAESVRRRSRRAALPLDAVPEGSTEFEGLVVSHHLLMEALGDLPESQREVVVLRFIAGLSAREVAKATGRTEAAITAMQVRAMRRLRRSMEEAS